MDLSTDNFEQDDRHARTLVLSYLDIRKSLGILGLLLPVLLGPVGWLIFGVGFQENMSSYYHTPLRDLFVGVMCSIGIFLFCYRGYDAIENWTANLAALAAIGVALFPMDPNSDPLHQSTVLGYLHTLCGGTFFFTLTIYSLYFFPHTPISFRIQSMDEKRDAIYRLSGIAMLTSMGAMGLQLFIFYGVVKEFFSSWNLIFWMEWIAVWAFAFAWLTKGEAILADIQHE